jgi:hypothetical protein
MLHISILWKLLKHHGKLGSDRILYRKSYISDRIIHRKSYGMTLLGPEWPQSSTVQSSTLRSPERSGVTPKAFLIGVLLLSLGVA